MVDYMATFNASYERLTRGALRTLFLDGFYDRFIATNADVAEKFAQTDFVQQKKMLWESLVEMRDFCVSLESNTYILTLARIHGVRGRDIPSSMFELWLDSLARTAREVDPEGNDNIELSWRLVMAPGIEFMKFYSDR
jgi:hypothetical protein